MESNRLSISEYTDIVKKIIFKLQKLGIKNIYFKMHHGEKLSLRGITIYHWVCMN